MSRRLRLCSVSVFLYLNWITAGGKSHLCHSMRRTLVVLLLMVNFQVLENSSSMHARGVESGSKSGFLSGVAVAVSHLKQTPTLGPVCLFWAFV